MKPTIFVNAAAGTTGFPTALQLIERSYPVRALARWSPRAWWVAVASSLHMLVTPGLDLDALNRSWAPAVAGVLVEESPLWRAAHSV